MNFMANRPGFYEDAAGGSRGSSSSSSPSSSSFHHRTFTQFPAYYGAAAAPPESAGDDAPDDDHNLLPRGGEGSAAAVIQREHMFDKVVTPSDVGKLNRLVIPKQHAEKYFPLDSSTNEKGLLLNFEDRNGKPWRFRYSYWNSSQSYVMTKGWSRFVKEKKLDAGDIVSFQRGVGELGKDRLFIDWRRRPDAPPPDLLHPPHQFSLHHHRPWGPLFMQQPRDHHHPYSHYNYHQSNYHHQHHPYVAAYGGIVNGNPCPPGSIMYLRSTPGGGGGGVLAPQQLQVGLMEQQQNRGAGDVEVTADIHHHQQQQMVFDSVPVVQGKAAAKRLRLFGVNMDCPISESDDDNNNNNIINECDILMSSSSATMLPHIHHHPGLVQSPPPFDSSQYSSSSSLARLRSDDHDKGKGSMSLDLDI